MFRKLLPFVLIAFVSACQPAGTTDSSGKMPCCEKCECCKDRKCGECCKSGKCDCCKEGNCPMCAKHKGSASAKEKECPMCLKAKQEQEKRKHNAQH